MSIRKITSVCAPVLALIIAIQGHAAGDTDGRFSHGARVSSISVSPDGKTVVSGGNDGVVRFWNANNGIEIRRLHAGRGKEQTTTTGFSPDGKLLAVGVWDAEANLYDASPISGRKTPSLYVIRVSDGTTIHTAHPGWIMDVAFSSDSTKLAWVGEDGNVGVINPRTGKRLFGLKLDGTPARAVAFSPDGKILAASVEDGVYLLNAVNGKNISGPSGIGANELFAKDLAFSPDSKHLAVGWGSGLRILDVTTQKWISRRIRGERGGSDVAYSPDGKTILYGGSIIDAITHKVVRSFEKGLGTFSPDGKTIWMGNRRGHIHQWDVATGKLL